MGAPSALAVVLSLLASGPASAYVVDSAVFADGSTTWQADVAGGPAEIQGAALRLFTNSTVLSGSVVLTSSPLPSNTTVVESTTTDFLSQTSSNGVNISAGTVYLATASGSVVLNASNNFVATDLTSIVVSGENLTLNGTTSGTLRTGNLTAPAAGWGFLSVVGFVPAGSSITVDVLSPSGTVLVASQPIGAKVDLDPIAAPRVRLLVSLDAASPSQSPKVRAIQLGQQVSDSLVGAGVSRTFTGGAISADGSFTMTADATSFTRYAGNPVLSPTPSTFYSLHAAAPFVIKVGSQWWMYFTGATCSSCPAAIGRAVSTDLKTWTVGATPVLNVSVTGWDNGSVAGSFVMADPAGPGYLMYYGADKINTPSSSAAWGLATSPDGVTWTKYAGNPVLAVSSAGGWDDSWVGDVSSVRYEAGTYTMYYEGASDPLPGNPRSIGVATSTDGRNWTKYASNPVLSPGGAVSFDTLDMAGGSVVKIGSTFHLYYSGASSGGPWTPGLATSTDGYSWTKVGAVMPGSAAWESQGPLCPVVFEDGAALRMLYCSGLNYKIGLADAAWYPAQFTATADFGSSPPSALNSLVRNVTTPAGAAVDITLASSSNLVSWSAAENMSAKTAVSAVPPARFVRWTVQLRATPGQQAAAVRSVTLAYSAVLSQGNYTSSPFPQARDIVEAVPTLALINPALVPSIRLSNDGGATWVAAMSGATAVFPAAGRQLMYALDFEATGGSSPVVDAVSILVVMESKASNITLRLASDASPFANISGVFAGSSNFSIPVAGLNAAIAAAPRPGPATVDVPIMVRSATPGNLSLTDLRLSYQLKNPLVAAFVPNAPGIAMPEGEARNFSTAFSSYPPQVKVNISWFIDAVEVVAARDATNLTYAADFNSAGAHTVGCVLENGDTTVSMNWSIAVSNVNRPPVISSSTPASNSLSISHSQSFSFDVAATDADFDPLSFAWFLDGNLFAGATDSHFGGVALPVGSHTVKAVVSDGLANVNVTWALLSTNDGPVITGSDPAAGPVSHSHKVMLDVHVNATDADGDDLSYVWSIDGSVASSTSTSGFAADPMSVGSHTVRVVVSDGIANASASWTLTVTNAAPTIVTRQPAGVLGEDTWAPQMFIVTASDADGDLMTYRWTLDGVAQASSTPDFTTPAGLASGPHTVTVVVTDALGLNATATWGFRSPAAQAGFDSGSLWIWLVLAVVVAAAVVTLLVRRRRPDEPSPP